MRLRTPLGLMIATVLLSLLVREWYPFSNFPMYSRFIPRTWYVYVTDGSDQPLPTSETFGLSTPKLKKIYRAKLGEHGGAPERAGIGTLELLASRAREPVRALRLWRVEVLRQNDEIVRESSRIAELVP